MSKLPIVLLVEDDPAHAELARRALGGEGHPRLELAESLAAARSLLKNIPADLVLADLHLPDGSGLELLEDKLPVVILTSQGDEARAVAAMKGGALDYLVKSPEMYRELPFAIERALRAARSERERLRAEASLWESEARFRQLAENIQDVFWLYDIEARTLIYASPAWARFYGSSEAPNLAQRLQHVPEEDQARLAAVWPPVAPTEVEYRVLRDDRVIWIAERTVPILDTQGRLARVAGLGTDMTRRRELEVSLRQSQKMQAVGQLAGGVAHDFNNMLTAILSAAEEIRYAQTTTERESLADLIISAAERVADLTRKLLAFSRKGRVQSRLVAVHQIIAETVSLLTRSIHPNVKIKTQLEAPRSLVLGDAGQLQNAFLNLGINARDAMPHGGTLCYRTKIRSFGTADSHFLGFELTPGAYLEISVEDSGIGIASAALGRIFEPFFTLKEVGKGTGLGLAAVYGTVVEHKGAIDVRSEPGRGATFILWLPLAEASGASEPAQPTVDLGTGTILLVDDEPLVLTSGSRLLTSLGYRVLTASSGAEALEVFDAHPQEIWAVVCDVVMPNLSGMETLKALQSRRPGLPVVLCSGYPREEATDVHSPAAAYLAKPFHRAEIAKVLANLAGKLSD